MASYTKTIEDRTFDAERSLYALRETNVIGCTFAGPADGESVLKEAKKIAVKNCNFSLRYPLWHVDDFILDNSKMDELTRAALWYCNRGEISASILGGIKALRECNDIKVRDCKIVSPEFGWKCNNITLENSSVEAEYLFLDSNNVSLRNVQMKGKYSFQYIHDLVIENCNLDTKDAFWHSHNITVRNSIVKGEYLAWFSDGLTLIDCKIIGTQPLCYCKNLKLINCTMEGCDLAFEYSDVEAEVHSHIDSIKNPRSGYIKADSIGEIIHDDPVMECTAKIELF